MDYVSPGGPLIDHEEVGRLETMRNLKEKVLLSKLNQDQELKKSHDAEVTHSVFSYFKL